MMFDFFFFVVLVFLGGGEVYLRDMPMIVDTESSVFDSPGETWSHTSVSTHTPELMGAADRHLSTPMSK